MYCLRSLRYVDTNLRVVTPRGSTRHEHQRSQATETLPLPVTITPHSPIQFRNDQLHMIHEPSSMYRACMFVCIRVWYKAHIYVTWPSAAKEDDTKFAVPVLKVLFPVSARDCYHAVATVLKASK